MKFNAIVRSYGLATAGDTVHHRIILIAEKPAFDPSELVKSFGQEMTIEMKPRQLSMGFEGGASTAKAKSKTAPIDDKDQGKMPLDDKTTKSKAGSGRKKGPRKSIDKNAKPPHPDQFKKTKVA